MMFIFENFEVYFNRDPICHTKVILQTAVDILKIIYASVSNLLNY